MSPPHDHATSIRSRSVLREAWLRDAVEHLRPLFDLPDVHLPASIPVSVGWPYGRRQATGQCWGSEAAHDRKPHIFVSPALSTRPEVLNVLAHELCHAADDCEHGHRGPFARIARGIGLEGPMRATRPGHQLQERLNAISRQLGRYPHGALEIRDRPAAPTRLIRVECPHCGYLVRTTAKWLAVGPPRCPDGYDMEAV